MLIIKIRQLNKAPGFRILIYFGLLLVSIGGIFFLFWPTGAYHAGARWVGEVAWLVLLLLAAVLILMAAIWIGDAQENHSQATMTRDFGSMSSESDRNKFTEEVDRCLDDRSISGYFNRNLIEKDQVIEVLVEGDAFQRACKISEYTAFSEARSKTKTVANEIFQITYGIANFRTAATFLSILTLSILLFIAIGISTIEMSSLGCTLVIFSGISGWLLAAARNAPERRSRSLILSLSVGCVALCAMILPPTIVNIRWNSLTVIVAIFIISLALGYLLATDQTANRCQSLITVGVGQVYLLFLRADEFELQRKWLDNCGSIIKEDANLTINTILGKDKDLFLVEQDSEGLRRLQDPSYTVPTKSEQRIASVLSQTDAASIALAGPRGAGKSTLLKKFSGPLRSATEYDNFGICLYLAAPAEYMPRDFISALFQQLCEEYLTHEGCALPKAIFGESIRLNPGSVLQRAFKFLRLSVRTVILLSIAGWLVRSFTGSHYHHMYEITLTAFQHWYDQVSRHIDRSVYKKAKPYWLWIRIFMLIVTFLYLLGMLGRWTRYFKPRREPALAKVARNYLRRLQIEKSVTWGAGMGLPAMRSGTLSLNRGGTASYVPWTFPELVANTRRFMQDVSDYFKTTSHAVIVGIDEIDRIGSLEHAEKFVGEIKAIFGVERCFFLVAVAEDVGSIFAQRATAGRSIVENAFDDIILVEPLDFNETRDLLLKRVPGFTDSFVYLVHALSGGLPRELIRITRRLVEVNKEASSAIRHPRLQDLAFCLVKEELIEAIRATRNQMARLAQHSNWLPFFERVQTASISLANASPFSVNESYAIIAELSELTVSNSPGGVPSRRELIQRSEDEAEQIVKDFTAFSFFGLTIIDAFSDKHFNLDAVQFATSNGSAGSYEELAAARGELAISSENSRAMLRRFRESLYSRPPGRTD